MNIRLSIRFIFGIELSQGSIHIIENKIVIFAAASGAYADPSSDTAQERHDGSAADVAFDILADQPLPAMRAIKFHDGLIRNRYITHVIEITIDRTEPDIAPDEIRKFDIQPDGRMIADEPVFILQKFPAMRAAHIQGHFA